MPERRARVCALLVWTVLVLAGAASSRAAELEGFGPIKFGMTEEEAWRAIDGKGEWDRPRGSDRILRYEHPTPFGKGRWRVLQRFRDGLASNVVLTYEAGLSRTTCLAQGRFTAEKIAKRHGVLPMIRNSAPIRFQVGVKIDSYRREVDIYMFNFEGGAFVELRVAASNAAPKCAIDGVYHRAIPHLIPF